MKDQDQTKQRVISLTNQQLQKGGQGGDSDKNTFVDRIVEGFRYTYFVMYTRSFEQELFNNSKILAVVLLLLKQLQILSLLFIPQVKNSKFIPTTQIDFLFLISQCFVSPKIKHYSFLSSNLIF